MSLTIAAMPAYNEERSIARMVLGCQKYVDRVIVVDDGSTDATADRAASAGAHVIRHEWNAGYGAGDGRRENGDHRLGRAARPRRNSAAFPAIGQGRGTLVIGSRFCNGNGQEIPAYRKVGMRILDITTRIVGGISVTDSQSGFRAYGRRAIDCI